MPQNALLLGFTRVLGSGAPSKLRTDKAGGLIKTRGGVLTFLDGSAYTQVFVGTGRLCLLSVLAPGTGVGAVYDTATQGGAGATNKVFVIPETAGMYCLDWPIVNGLGIAPGAGQVFSVSYIG